MTLKELRESYHQRSGKASDIARATNYSLIAVVWVLCGHDLTKISSYKAVLILLIISLVFDFIQYLIPAYLGMRIYRREEKKVSNMDKIDKTKTEGYPEVTPHISDFCFCIKFCFLFLAVCCLVWKIVTI